MFMLVSAVELELALANVDAYHDLACPFRFLSRALLRYQYSRQLEDCQDKADTAEVVDTLRFASSRIFSEQRQQNYKPRCCNKSEGRE